MSETAVIAVLGLSALSVLTTTGGVALALYARRSERAVASGIGFSVGLMLLISLLELLPEAIDAVALGQALAVAALGAGLVWIANLIVPHTHLVAEGSADAGQVRSAYLIVLGFVLHDLSEGFAMATHTLPHRRWAS